MIPHVDALVILSVIGAIVTMVNQTLIRKKNWLGWLLAIPNICFFSYVNMRAGSYGYAFLLGPFWLVNAIWAIKDWRFPKRAPVIVGMGCACCSTMTERAPATSSEIRTAIERLRIARATGEPEEERAALGHVQEIIARGWRYAPRTRVAS